MAWFSYAETNEALVDKLVSEQIIKSDEVAGAMKAIDRAKFCKNSGWAYVDSPQPIGSHATISAPHMVGDY